MAGRPEGRLDESQYEPFWEALQDLGVPLYIHPSPVQHDVWKVLQGYPGLDFGIWGWNHRTGGHAMRLIFGGVFDRFPGARIILGHMGEFLPAQLFRFDHLYGDLDLTAQKQLKKLPSEYFGTNIAITTSGVFRDLAELTGPEVLVRVPDLALVVHHERAAEHDRLLAAKNFSSSARSGETGTVPV